MYEGIKENNILNKLYQYYYNSCGIPSTLHIVYDSIVYTYS